MARRKIDKGAADLAAALDTDELPNLTAQQMEFVQGLLEGKTATASYRAAYNIETMSDRAVWTEASVLRNNPKIARWISAARKAHLDRAAITVESHTAELARLKELALEAGNHGAAIQAEQLRGKASGLYVDKFEDVTPSEPVKLLRDMLQYFPEIVPAITERVARPVPIDLTPIDAKSEPVDDKGESGR
jgi:hypothetical protein